MKIAPLPANAVAGLDIAVSRAFLVAGAWAGWSPVDPGRLSVALWFGGRWLGGA